MAARGELLGRNMVGKDKFSRKGTVALRTLKRPSVAVLQELHIQKVQGISFLYLFLIVSVISGIMILL